MIGNPIQVIDQGLIIFLFLAQHKIGHVESLDREMNQGILFLLHPFKTLQINNEDGWAAEHMKFLDCLLVHLASRAKPRILV